MGQHESHAFGYSKLQDDPSVMQTNSFQQTAPDSPRYPMLRIKRRTRPDFCPQEVRHKNNNNNNSNWSRGWSVQELLDSAKDRSSTRHLIQSSNL